MRARGPGGQVNCPETVFDIPNVYAYSFSTSIGLNQL